MNYPGDKSCCFCGSTLYSRGRNLHCSGDNLHSTKVMFDGVLDLQSISQSSFANRLGTLQEDDLVFDLFIRYWESKKVDSEVNLHCLHSETYKRDLSPIEPKLPIPEPFIPFPDLIEVALAEIMLDRELTGFEKDCRRHIPKIDESGQVYFAPLTWVVWPHSYISLKDMVLKTDYNEPPLPKIFDINEIRGLFSDRDGSKIDE